MITSFFFQKKKKKAEDARDSDQQELVEATVLLEEEEGEESQEKEEDSQQKEDATSAKESSKDNSKDSQSKGEEKEPEVPATPDPKSATLMHDPKTSLGDNTPGKRKQNAEAWNTVKRLRGEAQDFHSHERNGQEVPKTHCCVWCKTLLVVTKTRTGTWQSTKALQHMSSCPKRPNSGAAVAMIKDKDEKKKNLKQTALWNNRQGLPVVGGFSGKPITDSMKVKAAIVSWFCYSSTQCSKNTVNDPEFRGMLSTVWEVAGGEKDKCPFLRRQELSEWITAEVETCRLLLCWILRELLQCSKGNPPCQGLNDCATLASKKKHMAIGIEFVPPRLDANLTVCFGMNRVADGKDKTGMLHIEAMTKKMTRGHFTYKSLCNQTISDRAAKGIAKLIGHDEDACGMHDVDKIAKSALGFLLRTSNRIPINAFPLMKKLLESFFAVAAYFSKSQKRMDRLEEICVPLKIPQFKFAMFYNDPTRVNPILGTCRTILRKSKAVKVYKVTYPGETGLPGHTDEQWETLAESYGIAQVSGVVAVYVQHEKYLTGAMGVVLKVAMMQEFRADVLLVPDLEKVGPAAKLPMVLKKVKDFTELGKECLKRAKLEGERRFCGNTGETLTGEPVVLTNREKLALLLDPRTINSLDSIELRHVRKNAKAELRKCYVDYDRTATKFLEDQEAAEAASRDPIVVETPEKESPDAEVHLTGWESDDERQESQQDLEPAVGAPKTPTPRKRKSQEEIEGEFEDMFQNYRKRCAGLNWKEIFPKMESLPSSNGVFSKDAMIDNWKLNIGLVLKLLIKEDPDRSSYGWIPYMATTSKGSLGALLASSFCERVNSAANIILGDDNLRLDENELSDLVELRMNRPFLGYMKETYPHLTLPELKAMFPDLNEN